MANIIQLALRGLEFFFTIIVLALTGNMVHNSIGSPAIINYDLFVAIFATLTLFYLFAVAFNEGLSGHPMLPLGIDIANVLFWFCGAIATAAELGVHSCGNGSYLTRNHITNAAPDKSKQCHEAQAVCAFLWFGFAAFVASTALGALSGGSSVRGGRGGIRKGGPTMSQV